MAASAVVICSLLSQWEFSWDPGPEIPAAAVRMPAPIRKEKIIKKEQNISMNSMNIIYNIYWREDQIIIDGNSAAFAIIEWLLR